MQTYGYMFTDPTDIRFVILLTLSLATRPLTDSEITEVILNNTSMNFFDLEEQLGALVTLKEVEKEQYSDKQTVFSLSADGEKTIKFFYKKVPFSVREKLKNSVQELLRKEDIRKQITAEVVPVNFDEYAINCTLNDAGLPLLNFVMYAGSQETANKMAAHYQKHADEIYQTLLATFIHKDPEE